MRPLTLCFCLLLLPGISRADRFLLATFKNDEQQLRIMATTNAAEFSGYTQGPVYTPPPGNNLRDPSLIHFRGRYYVCHTAGNFGAANYFSVLVSDDLRTWTHLTDVSMAAIGNVRWAWAPEWFLDDDGSLHVLVSASTTEQITIKHNIYEVHPAAPDDLTQWTSPVEVTGPAAFPPWTGSDTWVGTYDPYVVKRGGIYWMFFFNVRSSCIELAWSTTSLTGPYEPSRTGNWQGIGNYKEGPTVMYLGGGRWRMIYADAIYSYLSYTDSTDNWATWSAPTPLRFPEFAGSPDQLRINHGTMIMAPGGLDLDVRIESPSPSQQQLVFQATANDQYRLWSSTNLVSWQEDQVLSSTTAGAYAHPLPNSGDLRQFWNLQRLTP